MELKQNRFYYYPRANTEKVAMGYVGSLLAYDMNTDEK